MYSNDVRPSMPKEVRRGVWFRSVELLIQPKKTGMRIGWETELNILSGEPQFLLASTQQLAVFCSNLDFRPAPRIVLS